MCTGAKRSSGLLWVLGQAAPRDKPRKRRGWEGMALLKAHTPAGTPPQALHAWLDHDPPWLH